MIVVYFRICTKTMIVFGLLNSCHPEHVFGGRSFTSNIGEKFTSGEHANSFRNDNI